MTDTKNTTLRSIMKHKIPLEGEFGIDQDEHDSLLDDQEIIRVERFMDEEDEGAVPTFDVECFQSRIGKEPEWSSVVKYRQYPSGSKTRNEYRRIQSSINRLYDES